MKKGDILQGYVERCDFPNKGRVVIKAEDGTQDVVTVKNALPGQTVSCVINKKKHGKAEGRLLEVVTPADCEIEAPCPHAGICGGWPLVWGMDGAGHGSSLRGYGVSCPDRASVRR